ncbi:hypothetical protein KSC_016390 [Ktedonobacter sp. SOSP1-52]|nr:hypothetical protein KSC_016390 [Ktedonobacter sp. SOSP1-52]
MLPIVFVWYSLYGVCREAVHVPVVLVAALLRIWPDGAWYACAREETVCIRMTSAIALKAARPTTNRPKAINRTSTYLL